MGRTGRRVLITVALGIGVTGFSATSALAQTAGGETLVVASVPDPASASPDGNVVQTFNLLSGGTAAAGTASVGPYPWALAITPDGATAYVANASSGTVTPVNVNSASTETALCLPYANCSSPDTGTEPEGMAVTPNGSAAYVVNSGENSLSEISLTGGGAHVIAPPITGSALSAPDAIAITPSGTLAWVANYGNGTVVPVNLSTGAVGSAIPVGTGPTALSITPNGQQLLVANSESSSVTVVSLGASPVTTTTVGIDKTGSQPSIPDAVAVSPNGEIAYVADAANDLLVPINLTSLVAGTAGSVCSGGGNCGADPDAIAISPDGSTAYVADLDTDSVSVLNLPASSANTPGVPTLTAKLATDGSPDALAVTPDEGSVVASFSEAAGGAGAPSSFDASASSDPAGGSLTYSWSFGDGSTLTTASPQTTHVYAAAGSYTVTLTVSNAGGVTSTLVYTGQTLSRNGTATATQSQLLQVAGTTVSTEALIAGADGSAIPAGFTLGSPLGVTIGNPSTVGGSPAAMAIAPDARTAYVVDSGTNAISQVDIATGQAYAAANWITVGSEPDAIAITPNGRFAYVVNGGTSTVTDVTLGSGGTTTIAVPAAAGAHLDGIAIPSNGTDAFVIDGANNTITPITLATGKAAAAVGSSALQDPDAIATAPDSDWAYVVNGGTPTQPGGLTAINISTGAAEPTSTVSLDSAGDHPDAIALAPGGATAYVVDAPTNGDAATVVAVSLSGATMTATAPTLVSAAATLSTIAVTPSGTEALVAGSAALGGVAVPIMFSSGSAMTLGTPVSLPAAATAVAITPDQGPDAQLAVSTVRLAAGGRVSADATGSSSGPVPLRSLSFSFGDGTAAVLAQPAKPTASHVYNQAGHFALSVTATDADGTSVPDVGTGQTLMFNGTSDARAAQTIGVYPTLKRLGVARALPGRRVLIVGTGFGTKLGATAIRFGTKRATVTCSSHTRCVAVIPKVPRGKRTVNVTVTVGAELSPTVKVGRFTFLEPKPKPKPKPKKSATKKSATKKSRTKKSATKTLFTAKSSSATTKQSGT